MMKDKKTQIVLLLFMMIYLSLLDEVGAHLKYEFPHSPLKTPYN